MPGRFFRKKKCNFLDVLAFQEQNFLQYGGSWLEIARSFLEAQGPSYLLQQSFPAVLILFSMELAEEKWSFVFLALCRSFLSISISLSL
jgi:hypothetical protein